MLNRAMERLLEFGKQYPKLRCAVLFLMALVCGVGTLAEVCMRICALSMDRARTAVSAVRQWGLSALRAVKREVPELRRHAPRRAMAGALALVMLSGMLPTSALAAAWQSTCPHDLGQHDETCGYIAAVAGAPCAHTEHVDCGYTEPTPETPCACEAAADGSITHADGCGYVPATAGTPCKHAQGTHDAGCGFKDAVAGALCTHEHDKNCGGLPAAESADPVCTCGAATDGNTAHTEDCALYVPAVCETCGEAHETADCPKEAARAPMTLAETPTVTVDTGSSAIFANGAPLVIEAGSTSKMTNLFVDLDGDLVKDENEAWIKIGDAEPTAAGYDLLLYSVYGGGQYAAVNDVTGGTKITITGGRVGSISGGGSSGSVTGGTNIDIRGGTVDRAVYGGGYNSKTGTVDSTHVTMTNGTVTSIYGGGNRGNVSGDTNVVITGGTVTSTVDGDGYSGGVEGTKNVTVGDSAKVISTSKGIIIKGSTGGGVTSFAISPKLADDAQINVSMPASFTGTTIATGATDTDLDKIKLVGTNAAKWTAYFQDGQIMVKATVLVTGVSLDKTTATLSVGNTETLTATVAPEDATNKKVAWTSSDTAVATVDASGVVTAVAEGTATITATASGKTATCAVTVTLPEIPNKDAITVTPYNGPYDGLEHDMVKVTGAPEGSTITYSRTGGNNSYGATIPTIKDVDTAVSVWVKVSLDGYEDYETKVSSTVSRAPLTPAIDMSGYTPREYDGTTVAAGAKIILEGSIASGETPTVTGTIAFETADAGNNKIVKATGIALTSDNAVNSNYYLTNTERSSTASIKPKAVAVEWEVQQDRLVYSGDDHSKRVTADYLTQSGRKSLNVSFDRTPFKNAGTYTATATMKTPDPNYTLTNNTREVTIARATRDTIPMGTPDSITVTSVTLADVAAFDADGPVSYGYSTENDISKVENWQESTTFNGLTSGTTYYFFAKTAQGTNYFAAQSDALEVKTLDKSLTEIAVTTPPTKTAYQAYETFDPSGMVVTATYDDETTATVDAADYTVSYPDSRDSFLAGDTKITITYCGKETTQSVTVTQAAGSGTVTLAGWTYGDAAKTPAPTSATNGINNVSYEYKLKTAGDEAYSVDVPTNAGTYTVKATFPATANYTEATATAEFTIAPRVAEFTWEDPANLVFDETEKQVHVSVSNAVGSDKVSGVLSGNTGTDAADYTAKVDSLSNNESGNYTLTGSTSATHAWSIAKASADALKAKLNIKPLNGTYWGINLNLVEVAGEPKGSNIEYSTDGKDFSGYLPGQKDVTEGVPIWVKVEHKNYETYTTEEMKAVVRPAPLTPTLDMTGCLPRAYDGTTVVAGAKITLTGNIRDEVPTATATVTFDNANVGKNKTVRVSNIVLDASNPVNKNYEISSVAELTGTASITPKEITVAAAASPSVTKVYDGSTTATVDAADYAFTGLVGSETLTLSGITAAYDKAGVDASKVTVNDYTLANGSGQASNYTLTNTTFDIPATITPRAYGDGTDFTAAEIPGQPYTGGEIKPEPVIQCNGVTLVRGTDYEQTLTYANNTDKGTDTASVTATLKGNYSGSVTVKFSIVDNPLDAEKFAEVFGVTKEQLAAWHNADIVLTAKDGWQIGMSVDSFDKPVTLSKEGAASTDTFYAKTSDGEVYQATVTYALDKSTPTIASITGNPTAWTNQSAAISFIAADALSGVASVTVKRGDTDYAVTEKKSFIADQNGDYVITATDTAGNTQTQTVKVEKIDKTAPTASIALAAQAPASSWFTGNVTVNVTVADDNLQKWQYSIDGGTWKDGIGSSFTISVNGDYTDKVKVKAIDEAGNETVSNVLTVKLDKATPAAPTVTVKADGKDYTGDWTAADVVFTLSGTPTTSGHAKYQVKVGEADWADVTGATYTVSANTPGDNGVNYQFRAVNIAGKDGTATSDTLVKRRALSDEVLNSEANKYTADSLNIGGAAITEGWYTTAPTVDVARKDTLAGNPAETWYQLDSGAETKLDGTTIPALADGTHTLTIWTKDAAGNCTTAHTVTVKVDTTAPAISAVTGNPGAWQNTDVTLTIAATDATSKLGAQPYSFDGGKNWQAEATKVYSVNATLGADTIQVKDAAGNIAKYATEIKIDKIDKTNPTVSTTVIDPEKWYGKTEITVTNADANSGVKTLTVQGGSFAAATDIKPEGKFTADEKSAGTYTYTVTVTDNAGNSSTATVTIQIDPIIDTFAKLVEGTDETDLDQLLDALDVYSKYTADQKTHIVASDAGAAAKTALDNAFTAKQDELAKQINDIIKKHPDDTKIADIDKAEELHQLLDNTHKEQIDDGKYQQMLSDRDAAENAITQLGKEDATYEQKQTAQNTYDSLSETQKKLVDKEDGMSDAMAGMNTDMAAVNTVIEKINAIQKPYKPEQKTAITEAKAAYDKLTVDQKAMFPAPEKARLDALVAMTEKAAATEALANALTENSGNADVLAAQNSYDSLSAEEKALVSTDSKAKLDAQYKAMLDKASADEKAAAAFAQQVTQTAAAPTVSGIEALKKAHDALSDGAKAALDEAAKTAYETLIATLTDAVKKLIQDLEKVDIAKLTPESKDAISDLGDTYDKLTEGQKELVDTATGGKLGQLTDAVKEAAKAEKAITDIPKHGDGSGISDGACAEQGHTIADHKGAIETAKLAYERLTDAGRALVTADAKTKLNTEYTALMKYMEYQNKANTVSTKVEVAGLAEKVQTPVVAPDVTKTVISVVMKDDKVDAAKLPEAIDRKKQAVSVDIKLEAQSYKGLETVGDPVSIQPKQGETVLVKLKVPTGYEMDTLEIWHVLSSGPARQIAKFWLVTEADGTYAVFEVSSFSHFVLFAEQTPTAPSGGGTPSYRPDVPPAEHGTVTVTPKNPAKGQTVTVTARPDDGYVVDKVVVTDQTGKEIPIKDNGDGTYSFTQPAGKVSISVTFQSVSTKGLPFADVAESDWFYESVKYAYENGLMNGTSTDRFGPDLSTSRAMLVTILWRLENEPKAKSAPNFSDVPAGTWYTDAVAWASENGIVEGDGNGSFAPNAPITREQLATILWRYAGSKKVLDYEGTGRFTDTEDISSWATYAVTWALSEGILTGKTGSLLDPASKASRAETAAMLMRFMSK